MRYIELEGNLFSAHPDYALCHCISTDCEMGKGIAVLFDKAYKGMKKYLKSQHPKIGEAVMFTYQVDGRNVFNLITKKDYWGKPTYKSHEITLVSMRDQMVVQNLSKIAMPLIGAGLDKLNWTKVSELIRRVFKDTQIDIVVYKLKK